MGSVGPAFRGKIMVVEDEGIVAHDLSRSLVDSGFMVSGVYTSAEDALNVPSSDLPDLALMDIRLQGQKDGISAALELKHRFDIPVVFITAHADAATLERAKATDPLGYLTKPFKRSDLKCAIELAFDALAKRRERKDELAEIWHQATHDPLTGLLNRAEFTTRLTLILGRARVFRSKGRPSLLLLDLSGLKAINETKGLAVGDAILQEVGQRLLGMLPPRDAVCRWGGDLFVAIMNLCVSPEDAQSRAKSIAQMIERPYVDGIRLGAHYSVVFGAEQAASVEQLVAQADALMPRDRRYDPA